MQTTCPLFNDASYSYTKDLSGDTYTLRFRWSDRLQQWLMRIDDAEENNLIRSVSLVPLYPLTQQYALEKPIGEFYLVPIETGVKEIPDPRNINNSHFLVYDDEV